MAIDKAYIAEREEALYELAKLAERRNDWREMVEALDANDFGRLWQVAKRKRDGRMDDRMARVHQSRY